METNSLKKAHTMKRKATPKIAVLATGLAASVMVVTMNPALPAQALPSYHQACNACHGSVAAGVSTAVPSATSMLPGASYTVQVTFAAGGSGLTGFWIEGLGGVAGGPSSATSYRATMKAPATVGVKSYKVWTRRGGQVGSVPYTITVKAAPVSPIQFGRLQFDSPGVDRATNLSINGEYVVIQNRGAVAKALTGWTVRDAQAHVYKFGAFTLGAHKSVVLRTGKGRNTAATRFWGLTYHVWGNATDRAYLRNAAGAATDYCAWTVRGAGYKVC